MATENYNEMTLVNLKEIAKEKGIKNISKLKKSELIEELVKITPNKENNQKQICCCRYYFSNSIQLYGCYGLHSVCRAFGNYADSHILLKSRFQTNGRIEFSWCISTCDYDFKSVFGRRHRNVVVIFSDNGNNSVGKQNRGLFIPKA